MSDSIDGRPTYREAIFFTMMILGALLGVSGYVASGQDLSEHFHGPSALGPTVSIATLRVPEKAWKHFAKAKEAAGRNSLAESDRETQRALAIAPDFAAAYLLRASSQVRERCFAAAIDSVREARRIEPDVMWSAVLLAGAYNGLHRYEDAQLALRNLRGVEATSWQVSYEQARAATGLNDVPASLRWSALALATAPENFADAYLVRANALLLEHHWSEAQIQMEVYLRSKEALDHRAEVVAALEDVKRRLRDMELQKIALR